MQLDLLQLSDSLAICRLDGNAAIPGWARGDFVSITRTSDELTIVCRQDCVPGEVPCEPGWRCLRIAGKLDFSLVGVIAAVTTALAAAGITVYVISTFDTDYFLLREPDLASAVRVLEEQGHRIGAG